MTTEDGYEQQFALNHLAGFLLTYKLLPYLLKEGGARDHDQQRIPQEHESTLA